MSVAIRELVLPLAEFSVEVTLELHARTTALTGPSGAGKTTLLELIAGLRKPRSGSIAVNDRLFTDRDLFVPPRDRRIGYVPQDDALFPHLSVRQNVLYGARAANDDVLAVLELAPLLERGVKRLSGGERKRIALARALFTKPDLLLLDEPLAGIDPALRERVLEYLLRVRDEFAIPTIYVTHHLEEAQALCEEIVVMNRGRVQPATHSGAESPVRHPEL
ncbi:MAG TPA: ATP-binding cassette domain-containing protein [Thermoanaerobaculia bacterium]|nr:ATP-binding cassette domain-containing protein [Thermoanaerobaculia bacterium]